MQNWILKNIKTFLLLLITTTCGAQTSMFRLKTADSLFAAKQYTQSFEHYDVVLHNKEYSAAMLLKMAFIQEGLGHVGKALYYLNLYQQVTHDPEVEAKMQELATKYNLEGYVLNDAERALTWYNRWYAYITVVLLALSVLILSVAFHLRYHKGRRPVVTVALFTIVCVLVVVHLQLGEDINAGVVAHGNTFVMRAPSSGADVVAVIGEGHRLEVVGKTDVWLRIIWDGSVGYVKASTLLPLSL